MKHGNSNLLEVEIDYNKENIESIEFLFKQFPREQVKVIKSAVWKPDDSSQVIKNDGKYYIKFTREDTYLFMENQPFYLDTRINLTDSSENPNTDIIPIMMNNSLFSKEDNLIEQG